MVSDPFLVGVFFGFVPSMGFLYILLHRFEGLFSDRRAFFAYLLGLGGGLVATLLQMFLGPSGREAAPLAALEVALFGVVHALVFAAFLNSRRFRARRDTPFYGVAFGLGFGALNVLFLVGNAVSRLAQASGSTLVETLSLTYIGLYFIGSILVHASVGAWIGRGAATRRLKGPLLQSAVVEAAYLGASFLLFLDPLGTAVPVIALAFSIALIARVLRAELETLIPPEIRREMDIHRRRIAREAMLAANRSSGSGPDEARTPDAGSGATPPRDPGSKET